MTIRAEKYRALVGAALLVLGVLFLILIDIQAQGLQPLTRSTTDVQATLDRGLERANAYAPYLALAGYGASGGALVFAPSRKAIAASLAAGATVVAGVWTLYGGGRWLTGN